MNLSELDSRFLEWLDNPWNLAGAAVGAFVLFLAVVFHEQVFFNLRFMIKSLARNPLRTILTALATGVLVFVVTLVWSIFALLDDMTTAQSANFKAIVTDRWQVPSQLPPSYESLLADGARRNDHPEDVKPLDCMSWAFFGATLDAKNRTRDNSLFFFCMDPDKLITLKNGKIESMMDDIDQLTPSQATELDAACKRMKENPRLVVIGVERLRMMNKKVGESIKVSSLNYADIDSYKKEHGGKAHPLAEKCVNLVWLRVPDTAGFAKMADQVESSSLFTTPAVKCETSSSGVAAFFDAYRDILFGMRWILVPSILATMALVIANAISISVRERRTEMAVLKVLGFSPNQIMVLILGEAVLVGVISGVISAGLTWATINEYMGGIKFPIAFIPVFFVPSAAWFWGAMIGSLTALAGSLIPSWGARSVKVSEVFSKVS
jgi:putative ABC transport system permease protein